MAAEKSKILIVGGTGKIGKHIVEASLKAGHPTLVLMRESTTSNPSKSRLIDKFKNQGAVLLPGDVEDHESLVKAVKQVDVVISSIGGSNIAGQINIIEAIKEAGNIKRFIPSEFGCDADRAHALSPAAERFSEKAKIRRVVESQGIPYTYICCYGFAGFSLPTLAQENSKTPPTDKVVVFGDGNAKSIIVEEQDIACYTIKAVDDPRTLNKVLYIRPPTNILSFNEIVSIWESKIGKKLERTYITEEELVKRIQESDEPKSYVLALKHFAFVRGSEDELRARQPSDLEATEIYPEVKYTTVEDYLDRFV